MKKLILKLLWLWCPPWLPSTGFPLPFLPLGGEFTSVSEISTTTDGVGHADSLWAFVQHPVKVLKGRASASTTFSRCARHFKGHAVRAQMFNAPAPLLQCRRRRCDSVELRPFLDAIPVGQEPEVLIHRPDHISSTQITPSLTGNAGRRSSLWLRSSEREVDRLTMTIFTASSTLPRCSREHRLDRLGLNAIANKLAFATTVVTTMGNSSATRVEAERRYDFATNSRQDTPGHQSL